MMPVLACKPGLVARLVALLLLMVLCTAPRMSAAAESCDAGLNDVQREEQNLCKAWGPCAAVLSLMDRCGVVGRWLDNLRAGGDPKPLTDRDVDRALGDFGANYGTELTDMPKAAHCLPSEFDRARCRQWLGLDPVPIKQPPPPPQPPAPPSLRARVLALYQESNAADAEHGSAGPHATTRSALKYCADARALTTRDGVCNDAQKRVDECIAFRSDWQKRKAEALAEAERETPGIGQSYTEGTSTLRGLGPQPDETQRWNDTIRGLRNMEMTGCPGFVDGTSMSPAQALAAWDQEDKVGAQARPEPSGLAADFDAVIPGYDAKQKVIDEEKRRVRAAQEAKEKAEREAREAAEREAKAKADAEAERQRVAAETKARDEAELKDKLQTMSAGELFALGDELSAAGKTSESNQAFRTLISRFPDSPLAVIAAKRLSGIKDAAAGSAAPAASRSTAAAGSGESNAKYSSVCMRNAQKVQDRMIAGDYRSTFATYDLAYLETQRLFAQVFQPCIGTDADAKRYYDQNMQNYTNGQQHCAGQHHQVECTQWGFGDQAMNQRSYEFTRAEVQRALSDPAYSRDMGTAKGEGGAPSRAQAPPPTDKNQSCEAGLNKMNRDFDAINKRRPADAPLMATLQALLYMSKASAEFIDSNCQGTPHAGEAQTYRNTYDQTMKTCQAMASSPSACAPQLAW